MAEAPAEPAPEAAKEEEEPKVGQGQGERAVTDHNSGRSPMHGPFRIPPQGGLF